MSFSLRARTAIIRVHRSTTQPWMCSACRRMYSDSAEPPPLLVKLRNDLKTAMRAKDTNRLNVLKGILAEVTNASKSSTPIQTDVQLLGLLRKKTAAAEAAKLQFKNAGRQDLVQKEEQQEAILQEYASGVDLMPLEQIKQAVLDTVLEIRASEPGVKAGNIMKALFAPGGRLADKPLDKSTVPGLVKQALTPS